MEEQLKPPFKLVSDVVLPDCRRLKKGIYNEWPANLPVPKSAKPVTLKVAVRDENDLPTALPDPEIEETVTKEEPNTLFAMSPKTGDKKK